MGGPTPVPGNGEGQTYCLRWNNHQTNLVQILHTLHEMGSYVDCTLVVDDEQFKAHRVVLAANSPYFQAILQDVSQDQCCIILPGVKGFEIAALLQYMYTGETTVTKSQEEEILRTAKELQVKGLYDNIMKINNDKSQRATSEERPPHPQQFQHQHHQHPQHHQQHHHHPTSSSSSKPPNGDGAYHHHHHQQHQHHSHHSSSVISTSTHISPSAAISSSCSPPPPAFSSTSASSYQTNYSNFPTPAASGQPININAHISAGEAPLTPTHSTPHPPAAGEAGGNQWPLSPSAAAAAAMLNSVYESAADMNPLKRKKLSAISSMLLNSTRDTPILRNVLAQANPPDSSQPSPLMLPVAGGKNDLSTPQHSHQHSLDGAGSAAGAGSHSFSGSDYGGDKEPLSPHTDRSFDDKKPEWKRYKQYTRADMMCAIQCVREGMSALQASRKFGLPSRTLYDKVRKLNITTGRGTHRTPKRSPPGGVESPAAFPYSAAAAAAAAAAHNYGHGGQTEQKREQKEHGSHAAGHATQHHHGMPPTIPHSAAALLDHAFLQQDIAGREALHAMALAAAAHAAANRMSNSPPGSNGHAAAARSPSHYGEQESLEKHERIIKREAIEEERDADADADADDEDDQVEDLSLAGRKERPESPYSPPPPRAASPMESASVIMHSASTNGGKELEEQPDHEMMDYRDVASPSSLALKREAQAHAD